MNKTHLEIWVDQLYKSFKKSFYNESRKFAIPKLIRKFPEGIDLNEERIENLDTIFPLQYLSIFENMPCGK